VQGKGWRGFPVIPLVVAPRCLNVLKSGATRSRPRSGSRAPRSHLPAVLLFVRAKHAAHRLGHRASRLSSARVPRRTRPAHTGPPPVHKVRDRKLNKA